MTGPIDPHGSRPDGAPRGPQQHDPAELGALALGLLDPTHPPRARNPPRPAPPASPPPRPGGPGAPGRLRALPPRPGGTDRRDPPARRGSAGGLPGGAARRRP